MPTDISTIDQAFPAFDGSERLTDKVDTLMDYDYQLLQLLKYSLHNLGAANFNAAQLKEIGDAITKPVYAKISDDEGNISALTLTAAGLQTQLETAEGNISTLVQTANGLATRVSTAEGNISTLVQTANGLTTRVSTAEGNISTLTQTIGALTFQTPAGLTMLSGDNVAVCGEADVGYAIYSDSDGPSTEMYFKNITDNALASANYYFTDSTGVSRYFTTNIPVGYYLFWNGINLRRYTTGGSYTSISATTSPVSGAKKLPLYSSNLVGAVKYDTNGTGADASARLMLFTSETSTVKYPIKIRAAGNISIESVNTDSGAVIWIEGKNAVQLNAGSHSLRVDTTGVYVDGSAISA